MTTNQKGFTLIILLISIVIIAVIAGIYFTQGKDDEQAQYEKGQEGIEQAREINTKSYERAQQLNEQMEIQNDLNSQ